MKSTTSKYLESFQVTCKSMFVEVVPKLCADG